MTLRERVLQIARVLDAEAGGRHANEYRARAAAARAIVVEHAALTALVESLERIILASADDPAEARVELDTIRDACYSAAAAEVDS